MREHDLMVEVSLLAREEEGGNPFVVPFPVQVPVLIPTAEEEDHEEGVPVVKDLSGGVVDVQVALDHPYEGAYHLGGLGCAYVGDQGKGEGLDREGVADLDPSSSDWVGVWEVE